MKRIFLSVIIAAVGICAWCENKTDAVTVQQQADDDFSYLLEGDGVELTFYGDNVHMTVNGVDKRGFTLSEKDAITICPAHTFKLTAHQDPNHETHYYSTFFTSEGAYKVPETATAYAGTVESSEKTDVLKLTDVGNIIHQGEAVILKAGTSEITLMPSCNKAAASAPNILEGTDVEKELKANQYALSYGNNGVGFYLWNGKPIGANKAYLTLPSSAGANAFIFQFDNGETTGIEQPTINGRQQSTGTYNLNGIRVNGNYTKGYIIKNGKTIYHKR